MRRQSWPASRSPSRRAPSTHGWTTTCVGADCSTDVECKAGAFCRRGLSCPGTCTARLAAGQTCAEDDDCEDGLGCSNARSVCAAPAQAGEACGGVVGSECAAGLNCTGADEDTGAAGTCKAISEVFAADEGASCDLDRGALCKDGLSCVASAMGSGVTLRCGPRFGAGAACRFGVPTPCPAGEYCNADITTGQVDGRCIALPAAGESCVQLAGVQECANGLLCDADVRCHPIARLGQPCASDEGCASTHCRNGSCVALADCAR